MWIASTCRSSSRLNACRRSGAGLTLLMALACNRSPAASAPGTAPTTANAGAPLPAPSPLGRPGASAADARHLLDRFAFGPRPGDVAAVSALGAKAWFEQQLGEDRVPDARAERAVAPYRRALAPPAELPTLFARGGVPAEPSTSGSRWSRSRDLMRQTSGSQILLEVQTAEIVRHIEGDHQVREVMVDFWTNHFSVYGKKHEVRFLVGDYVERVIRPAALGRFEDLLKATARHPAMLRYLDNASSRAKPAHGRSDLPGISENYARELLELHTLGIAGGYDQADVVGVARILTGWTFRPGMDGRGYEFYFSQGMHDAAAKVVLGTEFPAGGGEDEGLKVLSLVARHPSTARHLASKLCARFVADQPPSACVDTTSAAFLASGGDIKTTLRALVDSPTFWAQEHRRNKLKTPLEFLVSAVRGVDARLTGTTELARAARRLGEAPFTEPSPAGRNEDSAHWLESFTVERLGFAHDVAYGRVPGVVVDWRAALAGRSDPQTITNQVGASLFGGLPCTRTCAVIEQTVRETPDAGAAVSAGLALALSSPEFQWR